MPIRILIVDDSVFVRRSIRSCIETNTDWLVCGEADDGQAAIEMVRELKPDLVILDLAMPMMNGLDAARQISAIMPNLPMIMFTMLDCTRLLKATAQAAGIRHVFSKSDGFGDHVLQAIRALFPAA